MNRAAAQRDSMLHPRRVVGAIGSILTLYSAAFLLPAVVAVAYDARETNIGAVQVPLNALIFLLCALLTFMLGAVLRLSAANTNPENMADREAYLTVGIGWIALCLVTAVPYVLTGTLTSPVDAFFESMSGLTTTGATVIGGPLEDVSPSVHMWRAFTQYIGGMGIIVLSVAILAKLSQGGMQMLQAEVPGPTMSRVAPRVAQTARIMWGVYLALSAVLFAILTGILAFRHGMNVPTAAYEGLLHTFTTLSTGGFSNHTASIAYFDDPLIEGIIIGFILLAGTNFSLLLLASHGEWRTLLRDGEWRLYMTNFVLVSGVMAIILTRAGMEAMQAIRDGAFVVASMMTSTGFGTADFDQWPDVARLIIVFAMVAGGMAGSTAGGLKMVRVLLLWKIVRREFVRIRHPQAIVPLRIGGRTVPSRTIMATVALFFSYVALWLLGTVLLEIVDPAFARVEDAASASLSALSNVGPGLGVVGPTQSYAGLTMASKVVLSAEMWFGRLEIFTALLIFLPETWRH